MNHISCVCEYEKNCEICVKLEYLFSDTGDYSDFEIHSFSSYYHNNHYIPTEPIIQSKIVNSILCKTKKFRWNNKQKEYLLKKFEEFPSIGVHDIKSRLSVIRNTLFNLENKSRIITDSKIKSWFKNERERRKVKIN